MVEGLVFENAVKKGTGRFHAGGAIRAGINEARYDTQGLGIPFKAAIGPHQFIQLALTDVPKGGMAEVMGETDCLDQVGIDIEVRSETVAGTVEVFSDGAGDPGDLDGVGQARAVEIILAALKHLGFRLELAKGR